MQESKVKECALALLDRDFKPDWQIETFPYDVRSFLDSGFVHPDGAILYKTRGWRPNYITSNGRLQIVRAGDFASVSYRFRIDLLVKWHLGEGKVIELSESLIEKFLDEPVTGIEGAVGFISSGVDDPFFNEEYQIIVRGLHFYLPALEYLPELPEL